MPVAGLVLKLFIFLLPYLLWWMNLKQGMVAASLVDAGVIQKFYIFQARARWLQLADQLPCNACSILHA